MARTTKTKTVETQPAAEAQPVEAARVDPNERDERTTKAYLQDARKQRAQLLLNIEGGEGVDAQIDALDREIEQHETKLKRLAEARTLRDQQNTKEAREARRKQTRESLKGTLTDARRLGELATDALLAAVELGARLSAIEEARASIHSRVSAALQEAAEPEHIMRGRFDQLRYTLNTLTLPDHFTRRLWSAGLGRTGIKVSESLLHVSPLNGVYAEAGLRDPDEVITEAVENLRNLSVSMLKAAA